MPSPSPYDEPQHDPISPAPENLSGKPIEDIIQAVRTWFGENFESPDQETPRDSGDFVYIWGGPYDTRDIIENIFADDLTDDEVSEVVDDLERESYQWVPNSRRRQAPEEDETPPEDAVRSAEQLHAEMLSVVASVEGRLDALAARFDQGATHGIGHNQPPESIDDAPISREEFEQLRAAVAGLKAQPAAPTSGDEATAVQASKTVDTLGQKITSWAAKNTDAFVTELFKGAGKAIGTAAGTSAIGVAVWMGLGGDLQHLAHVAGQWLQSLHLPF